MTNIIEYSIFNVKKWIKIGAPPNCDKFRLVYKRRHWELFYIMSHNTDIPSLCLDHSKYVELQKKLVFILFFPINIVFNLCENGVLIFMPVLWFLVLLSVPLKYTNCRLHLHSDGPLFPIIACYDASWRNISCFKRTKFFSKYGVIYENSQI